MVDSLRDMLVKAKSAKVTPSDAMRELQERMTRCGAHLRSAKGAREALDATKRQYETCLGEGLKIAGARELAPAVAAVQQILTSLAMLKAICGMFERGAGSRGSHCILDETGIEMHASLVDPATGRPYRFKKVNEELRKSVLCAAYNGKAEDLFDLRDEPVRPIPDRDIAFEPAWTEFREGKIFEV
jgi:hypothetical protein